MSRRVQRVSDFLIVRIGRRRRETVPGDPQVASHQGDGIDVDGLEGEMSRTAVPAVRA